MNKIEEGIAAVDTAVEAVKNGYIAKTDISNTKGTDTTKVPSLKCLVDNYIEKNGEAGDLSCDHLTTQNLDVNGDAFFYGSIGGDGGFSFEASTGGAAIWNEGQNIRIGNTTTGYLDYAPDGTLTNTKDTNTLKINLNSIECKNTNGNWTFTGISDSTGTSSTIAASQKCLNDNYFPLTGGTITNDTTIMGSGGQYGIKFTNGDIQFLNDGGATVVGTITGISSSKGTSTTRAMSEKGVADNYLPLTGGTITGTLKLTADIGNEIVLRFDSGNYASGINYRTRGNEAMCFENKNQVSSFIFRTFDPSAATDAWDGVVPSMQIKNQKVTINKIIANGAEAAYNLDVNGTVNGTTLYENGASISSKYLPKADLPSNLLKYQIITSTSDIGTDANTAYLILE